MFFHVSEWEAAGCIYRGNHRLTHSKKKGGKLQLGVLFFVMIIIHSFNRWVTGWQFRGVGPLITSHLALEAGQMIHGFAPTRSSVFLR
jgi:hypothetical protein